LVSLILLALLSLVSFAPSHHNETPDAIPAETTPETTQTIEPPVPSFDPCTLGIIAVIPPEATGERRERLFRQEQLAVTEKLCDRFPQSANARFLMAMAYKEQGDSEAAVAQLQQTLQRQPHHLEAWEQLGFMAYNQGNFDESLRHMRRLLELDPRRPGIHLHIADSLTKQGRFDEAVAELQQEILLQPHSGRAYRLLGKTYLQKQMYPEARAALEKAIEREPNEPQAYYTLSTVCVRLQETDRARDYRRRFQELEENQQASQRQVRLNLDPLQMVVTSVAHTHTDVGRLYAVSGQAGPAEMLWKRAAEIDPQNRRCRMELAGLYQRGQRPQEALRWCREVVAQDPGNGQAHYMIGNLHRTAGRLDEAEAAFQRVIALSPTRPEGYQSLAVFYLIDRPDPSRAVPMAQAAAQLAPTVQNQSVLAEALWRRGDRAQAEAVLQKAQQQAPYDAHLQRLHRKMTGPP
jgi:tetratricopeptide (TPR) repeat protein